MESEAYKTTSAVKRMYFGIKGDTLADFVPRTYDFVADCLENMKEH
ncbi:MAG: hypothetical protein IJ877_07010 [Candidatus Gastranaerophilales bacterium]|nr:hypothetical protein [Candidatus Gastranaerophilales bacterium]